MCVFFFIYIEFPAILGSFGFHLIALVPCVVAPYLMRKEVITGLLSWILRVDMF